MTSNDLKLLREKWSAEIDESDIGLLWILADVREQLGLAADEDQIRSVALEAIRPLLESGILNPMSKMTLWGGLVDEKLSRIEREIREVGATVNEDVSFVRAGFRPIRPIPFRTTEE